MASPAALRLMAISALLLLCAPTTFAALTPGELVTAIRVATTKGQALQSPAQQITITSGPLIVIGLGPFPKIIAGFTEIITDLSSTIAAAKGSEAISSSDAKAVEYAVKDLVYVDQVLLNILIGKAGLFRTVPIIGVPVSDVLRQYQSIVDAFMYDVIDLVPSDSAKVITDQLNSLDATMTAAVKAYEGLDLVRFWQ